MSAVWIVDDDRSIRWVLEKALAREEIPYKSFGNANDVLTALDSAAQPPRVLVSDIRMPGESGLSLLHKMRLAGIQTPVLILTALGSVDDRVNGLKMGGDDYLVKPFFMPELLARVEALNRRSNIKPAAKAAVQRERYAR